MIHNLAITIITLLCVSGVTASKETTLLMRVLGMLTIFAAGKGNLVLQVLRRVLVLVVVVVAFYIKPYITKVTFCPRISDVRLRAPWSGLELRGQA